MNNHDGEEISQKKRELLVILTGKRNEESFERISADYKMQQVVSDRVFVIEGDQNEAQALKKIPDTTVIAHGDEPSAVLENLDEGESIFVSAWISRSKEDSSKKRPGEGLNWDAPGFEPPDPAK